MNLPQENAQVELALPEIDVLEQARVLLYNDDWHTFDEVIDQLMIALGCNEMVAEDMAWTVHNKGICNVYTGKLERCFEISAVLEEIELKTEILF